MIGAYATWRFRHMYLSDRRLALFGLIIPGYGIVVHFCDKDKAMELITGSIVICVVFKIMLS